MVPRGERSESIIINHVNITRYEYQHKRNINISTVKTSHTEVNIWKFGKINGQMITCIRTQLWDNALQENCSGLLYQVKALFAIERRYPCLNYVQIGIKCIVKALSVHYTSCRRSKSLAVDVLYLTAADCGWQLTRVVTVLISSSEFS